MSETTKIPWCDSTGSPWTGCTPVSAACLNCYAQKLAYKNGWCRWGRGVPRHRFTSFRKQMVTLDRWTGQGRFRECALCGGREFRKLDPKTGVLSKCSTPTCLADPAIHSRWAWPKVFPSLCDWLDAEVPVEWLVDLMETIIITPRLDWLLLSKRCELWRERLTQARDAAVATYVRQVTAQWLDGLPIAHVWVGATVEDPDQDHRIAEVSAIPSLVHFLSVEPMLGPVSLDFAGNARDIDWVICGGESGGKARALHPHWVRALRDQCSEAGVPFCFKQWGDNPSPDAYETVFGRENASRWERRHGRKLDGLVWNQTPQQVRRPSSSTPLACPSVQDMLL